MAEEKRVGIFAKILRRRKLVIALVAAFVVFLIARPLLERNNGVETIRVKKGEVAEELVLSGVVAADEYARLAFGTSGKVSWVGVGEGDEVKKGQALTKLDTTNLNSDYQRARQDLWIAEATLAEVYDEIKGHGSDETFAQRDTRTTAEGAVNKAYEAVIKAKQDLENATLIAPFAGIVTYVANPFSGVNTLSTQAQIELINPETIYFDVSADQSEVTQLSLGQKVKIVLDSYPEEEFEGEVDFISYTPKSDEVGTVYKIKVKLRGVELDAGKFRIGMGGDAGFILSKKEDVLYIPPKFLNSDPKGKYVNKNKKNNRVYVETGIESEDRVEIISGLEEGDELYD
jgi:RND family efflux transporter MFP subunit